MIGKIIIGNSFGPCISYVLGLTKVEKEKFAETGIEKATVLKYNYCYGDRNELTQQFNDVKNLNQKMNRAVAHIILSFAQEDEVSNNQMIEIAHKLSIKMGFEKNQYLLVKHNDVGNHLHLVLNRTSFEGKTLSDSNNYKMIAEFCREMELEYNFRKVLSPKRFLPKDQRDIPREDVRVLKCKAIINEALNHSTDWDELQYKLLAKGITMEKGRGVAFIDDKNVRIKGSKIGYSFDKIEKYFQNNENELLHTTRLRI